MACLGGLQGERIFSPKRKHRSTAQVCEVASEQTTRFRNNGNGKIKVEMLIVINHSTMFSLNQIPTVKHGGVGVVIWYCFAET